MLVHTHVSACWTIRLSIRPFHCLFIRPTVPSSVYPSGCQSICSSDRSFGHCCDQNQPAIDSSRKNNTSTATPGRPATTAARPETIFDCQRYGILITRRTSRTIGKPQSVTERLTAPSRPGPTRPPPPRRTSVLDRDRPVPSLSRPRRATFYRPATISDSYNEVQLLYGILMRPSRRNVRSSVHPPVRPSTRPPAHSTARPAAQLSNL